MRGPCGHPRAEGGHTVVKQQETRTQDAVVYAINRKANKAYRRTPGDGRWEPVELRGVSIEPGTERVGSEQIDGRWFALYPVQA